MSVSVSRGSKLYCIASVYQLMAFLNQGERPSYTEDDEYGD